MGSQQLLLIGGGILLLGLLSLLFYKSYGGKVEDQSYIEALITGVGVGRSMIDEIQTRAFDEATVTKPVSKTSQLTPPSSLGPDAGENSVFKFDDVDDFNNYSKADTMSIYGVYNTSVKVYYVNKMAPNTVSSTQTYTKRIDVKVTNKFLKDTLKFNYIITY